MTDGVRISRTAKDKEWLIARTYFDSAPTQTQLEEVFERFFEDRLDSRYFEPIRLLGNSGKDEGEGFAIVTLYCSIIEFLASIRAGKNYRFVPHKQRNKLGQYEYCESKQMFVTFISTQEPFKKVIRTQPAAADFYLNVRCALVHEARTKGHWRVKRGAANDVPIDTTNKVIYRSQLPPLFREYISTYKEQFLSDKTLQANFKRKFDHLCDLPPQ